MKDLYVSKQSQIKDELHFSTIQDALDVIPKDNQEEITIHIANGTYFEKLTVQTPYVTFEGESAEGTILTYNLGAYEILEDGIKRGTFRTPSVFIDTHDFTARNITFENSAGFGHTVGQALALYVDGDKIVFDNCRLLGSQDTLFTAPLPPFAYEPGGLRCSKEFEPRINGRQYYKNCYIRGDIDFIFGGATAYFENCEIFCQKNDDEPAASNPSQQKTYSFITAPCTPEGQEYGYVFEGCKLTSDCPKHSCYLGRPWRDFAKSVFLRCEIGEHIHPAGWDDWGKEHAHSTLYFAEYKNKGAGASIEKRASFSCQLTDEEALLYSKEKVFDWNDGWNPA